MGGKKRGAGTPVSFFFFRLFNSGGRINQLFFFFSGMREPCTRDVRALINQLRGTVYPLIHSVESSASGTGSPPTALHEHSLWRNRFPGAHGLAHGPK